VTPNVESRLAEGSRLLAQIGVGAIAEHRHAIESLMSVVFALGTAFGRDPALAPAAAAFLDQLRSRKDTVLLGAYGYVRDIASLLRWPWHDDEWSEVCRSRSAIEFLRGFLSVPPDEEFLDTEIVDDLIRERGQTEGPVPAGGVAPGIPASHWWWWRPDRPPEG
jgi:hypothetical protein